MSRYTCTLYKLQLFDDWFLSNNDARYSDEAEYVLPLVGMD